MEIQQEKIKLVDLKKQYRLIDEEIKIAINRVLEKNDYIGGNEIKVFEEEFKKYINVNNCVACGNGTDALELALKALELKQGSEIIVPANSFAASAEAIVNMGYLPRFVDINEDDFLINLDDLKSKINEKTSAIMVVHLYGNPFDIEEMKNYCNLSKNIKIIEDCAQAHGAKIKDKKVGSIGDVGCFSFYPGKNLGAYGDAGAITTNDTELALKIKMLANHGRVDKYNHKVVGRNSRMDTIQAAVLNVKLKYIDSYNKNRINIAKIYNKFFSKYENKMKKHVYHLYVIKVEKRNLLQKMLLERNIETGVHYPISLPKLEAFKEYDKNDTPVADSISKKVLSLPINDSMTSTEAIRVIDTLIFLNEKYNINTYQEEELV